MTPPKPGDIIDGYMFKGGDPASPSSWASLGFSTPVNQQRQLAARGQAAEAMGGAPLGPDLTQQSMQQETASRGPLELFNAGIGTPLNTASLRLKQALVGLTPQDQQSLQMDQQIASQKSPQLLGLPPGLVGNIAGNTMMFGPAFGRIAGAADATPAARILGSSLLGGAQAALTTPTGNPVENAKSGAGLAGAFAAGGEVANGLIASREAARRAALTGPAAGKEDVAQAARDAGLKINPVETNPSVVTRGFGMVSGRAASSQSMSRANVEPVQQLAAEDIGLTAKNLTPAAVEQVKNEAAKAYDAIRNAGPYVADDQLVRDMAAIGQKHVDSTQLFPTTRNAQVLALSQEGVGLGGAPMTGNGVVEQIKQLRFQASGNIASKNPADKALGFAQKDAANALESFVDRSLSKAGPSDALWKFRVARQTMAKASAIEDAMDAGGGNTVSALNLGNQLKNGAPLTGNLKLIAEAARNFPRDFQEGAKVADTLPLTRLDLFGTLGAVGGGAALGGPLGAAAGLAWPAARVGAGSLMTGPANQWMGTPGLGQIPYGLLTAPVVAGGQNGN